MAKTSRMPARRSISEQITLAVLHVASTFSTTAPRCVLRPTGLGGEDSFVALEVWRVHRPVRGPVHGYKCSLAFVVRGVGAAGAARRESVHGDVGVLVTAGVLDRTEDGVEFPYNVVHVDFTLGKAA